MIAFAAMGELITILVLSLVEVHTIADGDVNRMIKGMLLLLALVTAAVIGASLLRLLMWWYPTYFTQLVAHDDPTETGIRVGFAMMFAFIGLSILTHVEPFWEPYRRCHFKFYRSKQRGLGTQTLLNGFGFFVRSSSFMSECAWISLWHAQQKCRPNRSHFGCHAVG